MNIKLDYQKILGLNSSVELLSKIGAEQIPGVAISDKEADKALKIKAQQLNKIGQETPIA